MLDGTKCAVDFESGERKTWRFQEKRVGETSGSNITHNS